MRLQAENNKLRDSLTEILERTGYFIKEANPRIYQEAQEALAIRYGEDRPDDFDDSFMDRVSDEEETEEDKE